MQSTKIVIVGGGLGGLALAQGLKHATPTVPFHIYERDSSPDFRPQGYRIRINPDGAGALQALLPDHLWEAFQKTCALVKPGGHRLDALTAQPPQLTPGRSGPPPMPKGKSYNADRVVLRNLLLQGLEDNISFGKAFKSYRLVSGSVEVTFNDGTKETGFILVGADGSRSLVRRQLMPSFSLLDTEGRAIFGKTFTTPETRTSIPRELIQGMSLVKEGGKSPLTLFSDMMQFSPDMSLEARNKHKIPDDYVYWVLCYNNSSLPAEENFLQLDNAQSAKKSSEMSKTWHPSLRSLFKQQDEASSSTLTFSTCSPSMFKEKWDALFERPESAAVTLLGDSAHPMTPVGGVGANTAFQDAADLYNVLTRSGIVHAEALEDYAKPMTKRAQETVERSGQGAGHMFQMKPFSELKAV